MHRAFQELANVNGHHGQRPKNSRAKVAQTAAHGLRQHRDDAARYPQAIKIKDLERYRNWRSIRRDQLRLYGMKGSGGLDLPSTPFVGQARESEPGVGLMSFVHQDRRASTHTNQQTMDRMKRLSEQTERPQRITSTAMGPRLPLALNADLLTASGGALGHTEKIEGLAE